MAIVNGQTSIRSLRRLGRDPALNEKTDDGLATRTMPGLSEE
jgi:hypothetical protein